MGAYSEEDHDLVRSASTVQRAARLLLLAAIAAPCTGFAQSDPTDDLLGVIAERITEAQARGGPYSTELIDPLKSLSVAL